MISAVMQRCRSSYWRRITKTLHSDMPTKGQGGVPVARASRAVSPVLHVA